VANGLSLTQAQSDIYNFIFKDDIHCDVSADLRGQKATVVCGGRGGGKTLVSAVVAMSSIQLLRCMPGNTPHKNVVIAGPVLAQTRDIYYDMLANVMGLEKFASKSSKALGMMEIPTKDGKGSVSLNLTSYERIENLRGSGIHTMIMDEANSCKNIFDVWQSVIMPCQITRWPGQFKQLAISTPTGYNQFYDLYQAVDQLPYGKAFQFDYTAAPHLDPNEIERIRSTMDKVKFAQEYLALFSESGNSVFHQFKRDVHVFDVDVVLNDGEPILVSIDFNVAVMAATAWVDRGGKLYAIRDFIGSANTGELCSIIKNTFQGRKIIVFPDSTGAARKTSSNVGQTDHTIIKSHGFSICARSVNPPVVDSVNSVNAMLMNALDEPRMFFHKSCVHTIKSMERTVWVDGSDSALIDKTAGDEHHSDGVRYIVQYLYPLRSSQRSTVGGFGF
jgi:Terminase large subunit, T4likevirus-type, N-terminal